jgi:hypothetical protein
MECGGAEEKSRSAGMEGWRSGEIGVRKYGGEDRRQEERGLAGKVVRVCLESHCIESLSQSQYNLEKINLFDVMDITASMIQNT